MGPKARVATVALAAGVLGWTIEDLATGGPRYSKAFGGAHVPLLPVYAAGGAALALLAPRLRGRSLPVRALAYALATTAIEAAAGSADRAVGGPPSWDYRGRTVEPMHTLAWTGLALLAEPFVAG